MRPGYLRAFLNDPQTVKPGTTMPHLFAALPAEEKAATVEALVHFLATTGEVSEREAEPKAISSGKKLYHEIGCVACHGRRDQPAPRLAASLPLGDLGRKYTLPSLATFLQDPLKVRPTRPDAALEPGQERGDRAGQLPARSSCGDTGPAADEGRFPLDRTLAEKGRALFERVGCASCHQLRADEQAIASTLIAPRWSALAAGRDGCIALAHAASGLMYRLDDRQRDALIAALKAVAGGKLPAPTPRDVVVRTMTALNCYACHVRDGRGGVEEPRQAFFKTTQQEMGDEGRIPPEPRRRRCQARADYMGGTSTGRQGPSLHAHADAPLRRGEPGPADRGLRSARPAGTRRGPDVRRVAPPRQVGRADSSPAARRWGASSATSSRGSSRRGSRRWTWPS